MTIPFILLGIGVGMAFAVWGYITYHMGIEAGVKREQKAPSNSVLDTADPDSSGYIEVSMSQYMKVRAYSTLVFDRMRQHPITLVVHPGGDCNLLVDWTRGKQSNGKNKQRELEQLMKAKPLDQPAETVGTVETPFPSQRRQEGSQNHGSSSPKQGRDN